MRVVIQESDFQFVFEVDVQPFDGSEEALDKRTELLAAELDRRVRVDDELRKLLCFPPEEVGGEMYFRGRDYYVDKVTTLTPDAELWGLGT